ncbi:hypothetical protein B0T16DRAFT_414178 [Cercophora newfieldiana]|uniref:AA1-like domain-containing protein n=1 Tax=Cercophora newfieldiana TaxID=92897 RepID=A0AA39Y7C8_9PEZI|nr:hypothetical protein B0T16DRAFT_414178 [Cercophora newfieldiana]
MFRLLGLISGLVGLAASRALSVAPRGDTPSNQLEVIAPSGYTSDFKVASTCSDISTSNPRWEITKLVFTSIDYREGSTKGDIRFVAHNVAADTTFGCVAENIDLKGATDVWYDCSIPGTSFQFVLATYDLKMRGTWSCSDAPATKYSGSGTLADSWIARCDDYPDEIRGWESVCMMADGIVAAKLSPQGISATSTEE